jgi:hypothetical protein
VNSGGDMIEPETIKSGYVVSIDLIQGTAPYDCYIGQVRGTNKYGIKINPLKWDGSSDKIKLSREDFYIPWKNINSMLVCTE